MEGVPNKCPGAAASLGGPRTTKSGVLPHRTGCGTTAHDARSTIKVSTRCTLLWVASLAHVTDTCYFESNERENETVLLH